MKGIICEYLTESPHPDFKWACSLRLKYRSWEQMYKSDEYIRDVKPKLLDADVFQDCGDWPPVGRKCGTCGVNGYSNNP